MHEAEFAPERAQVRAARRFVAQRVPADVRDNITLVVSELVTNAIEHARTPVTLRLAVAEDRVRVEVADSSAILPAVVDLVNDSEGGRGLRIVEEVTDAWGIESSSNGKLVWFEVSRPPA